MRKVAALALALWAQGASAQVPEPMLPQAGPATPQGALPFTPPTVINVTDPAYGVVANSTNSSVEAANFTAFQAAATAACAVGNAQISLPPAPVYVTLTAGQAALPIPCTGVSVVGAGMGASIIFPTSGSGGDFLDYTPPANKVYGGGAVASGFAIYRADNPTTGRGIFADHTQNQNFRDIEISGMATNFDCNACRLTAITSSAIGGVESQTGTYMVRVHHTNAYETATAPATLSGSGSVTIATSSVSGTVYYGQTLYDTTISSGALGTVTAWTGSSVTIAVSGSASISTNDALSLLDVNVAGFTIDAGSFVQGATTSNPWAYDYGIKVENCDGCFFGDVHVAYSRYSDLYVQPGYSTDKLDNIFTDPKTYFDTSGVGGIDFEPYGAFTTTTSGSTASANTTLSLSSAAPAGSNGWTILANGVPTGTTVSSGQGTTTLTMSAGANTLGVASGATVTLYPAFTGVEGDHNIYGYNQGATTVGVTLNDPALVNTRLPLQILNAGTSAVVANAGSYVDLSEVNVQHNNVANAAGNSTILVQGSANNFLVGGHFAAPAHAPTYLIDFEGQASNSTVGQAMVPTGASGTADVFSASLGTGLRCSSAFVSFSTHPGCGSMYSAPGVEPFLYGKNGQVDVSLTGGSTTTAYPVLQATAGASVKLYAAGGGATTMIVDAESGSSGTLDLGNTNGDTINAGKTGVVKALNLYNYPYSQAGTPTVAANACGSSTQGVLTGTDLDGTITVGTASVTSCTISFSTTLPNTPRMVELTPANATAAATGTTLAYVSAISSTAWTITGTALASAKYYYHIE